MTSLSYVIRVLRKLWDTPPKIVSQRLLRALRLRSATEYERLQEYPRYVPTTAHLLGRVIEIVDAASYLFMKREIFDLEIYKFSTTRSSPLIIDCGANIGLSVIYLKQLFPQATVVAFEPDRQIFSILQRNVAAFNLTNVVLREQAVWSEVTTLSFYREGADGGRIALLNDDSDNIAQIETVRLRDFLHRRVDFLKLDIEGAEYIVLDDCRDCLDNVERLFVEFHSFADRPQKLGELLELLEDSGFRLHIESPGLVSPHPFVECREYAGMDLQCDIYAFRR
jgi:FkbM family methyltransferase